MTTYYVSPSGSDSANGLTQSTPWQTLTKVNATSFAAGDFVLLEGGQTFAGGLAPTTSGTPGHPITFGSYGNGRARISSSASDGVLIYDVSGFVIRDLILTGAGVGVNTKSGINFYNDTAAQMTQAVTVRNCEVSAFEYGIIAGGDTHGWTTVLIEDCNAYGNQMAGISTYGAASFGAGNYFNTNVTVRRCTATANLGDAALTTTNGSGIVLGSVDIGLIELCSASGNGTLCTASEGPVGIWAFDSRAIVIQRCISYSNRSAGGDGGGFDFDQNTSNSTIQYCLAYDNDGPGFLLAHGPATAAWTGNIYRFNLSWGNCRVNSTYGELHLFGTISTSEIYNNTFIAKATGAITPTAVAVGTHGSVTASGIKIRNNVIVQLGTANLMQAASAYATTAVFLQGNAYYRPAGFSITWSATYTSLAAWRAVVTGQEQVSGTNVGLVGDPQLVNASAQPTATDPKVFREVPGMRPALGSPLVGAGLNLFTAFAINPGTVDYGGSGLVTPYAIGALGLVPIRQVFWEIDPASEDPANVALSLTDSTFRLLADGGMDLTPPDIDPIYAASADTEGDPFVGSRHRNRTIVLSLLAKTGTDALTQTAIYGVQQKVDKLRREGGTLKYTTQAGTEIVFDVVFARFKPEFTAEHYALNKALPFSLEFECRPYGRGAPVLLPDHTETTLPCLVFTETTLAGDVPGLGKLVVDDDQGKDQWWMIWGYQSRYYDSSANAALFYEAEGRLPAASSAAVPGPSGASGAGSDKVIRNTNLTTSYQMIMSTQAAGGGAHLSHVGSYRFFARVQLPVTNTGTVSIALSWGVGDFQRFTTNTAVVMNPNPFFPVPVAWRLIDLGMVNIPKVAQGTQQWEGRILAKSTVASDDMDIDYFFLVPADEGSGEVSGLSTFQTPTTFSIRDEFDQTAGALAGKTAPTGQVWSGAGDADDFVVETTFHTASRTAVSDTSGIAGGRHAIAGTTAFTNVYAQVDGYYTGFNLPAWAVMARWTDVNNCVFGYVSGAGTNSTVLIGMRVASVETELAVVTFPYQIQPDGVWKTIRMQIDDQGRARLWWFPQGAVPGQPLLECQDPTLATGGALATGKVGFMDNTIGAAATTRYYNNFFAAVPTKDAAVYASQSLEIRPDQVIRKDSAGVVWAKPSSYEGDHLKVLPAGKEARSVRFIVKGCRNDPVTMPDTAIDDISARLTYTPRYLVLPN